MKDLIIVKKALSKDTCKLLARQFRMSREIICDLNPKMYDAGDDTVKKSFSWYAPLCFESLADTLIKDIIEEEVGHKLYIKTGSSQEVKFKTSRFYAVFLCN